MLCCHAGGKTVGASECDVARLDTARHVVRFGCRVDDLIDSLHGEIESHEFTLHRGSYEPI